MIHKQSKEMSIPALGFGTWQLEGEECSKGVQHALELGCRHIDTAAAYGNEEQINQALQAAGIPRTTVFITTKVWYEDLSREATEESVRNSLERLGTDYLDLVLIHWPPPEGDFESALEQLAELKAEGRIRHIGVSNFTPEMVDRARRIAPIVCNQVEYHPFLSQQRLIEQARALGIIITAYCPLAQGRVADDPTLQEIGDRHGKTPAQVTLRWLVQQPQVVAIPRSSSAEHRRQNMDIFDFELSAEEMGEIHRLARGRRLVDPDFAPEWEARSPSLPG